MVLFSTTDRESLLAVPKWVAKVKEECGEELPMVSVMNKVDLISQAKLTQ